MINLELLELLLKSGADLTISLNNGMTAVKYLEEQRDGFERTIAQMEKKLTDRPAETIKEDKEYYKQTKRKLANRGAALEIIEHYSTK